MVNKINSIHKDGLSKPIVLVGMMGCGKSHVSRHLAKILDIDLYDSDKLIEQEQGKSITQIFKDDGEDYFRIIESKKICDLLDKGVCIISTGGGAVTSPKILDKINNRAVSIWIKSDVDVIMRRIKNDNGRPILQCNNPREKLKNLLNERDSLYAVADIHVDNSLDDLSDIIDKILQGL